MDRGRLLVGADRAAAAALAGEVAGPTPVADRLSLPGILYVLHNDIARQLLPLEPGFGAGQTCWRRLERWQQAEVFDQLHRILLAELNAAGELDRSRACVDGSHFRATKDGADTGPSPVDRRKTGSKHHLICDGRGTPLKVMPTAANVNDVTQTSPGSTASRPWPDDADARAAALTRSPVTGATTPTPTAESCASGESCRSSPARAPRTARVRVRSATSSSTLSPCSTSTNALPSVANAESNCTMPSLP